MAIIKSLAGLAQFPDRIVSLVPSISESLIELGMGDRLTGITDYCVFPTDVTNKLPKVGGTKDLSIEAVVDLQPDLVIANQEENDRQQIEFLAKQMNVWLTFPRSVNELLEDLRQLVYLFRADTAFHRLRSLEMAIEYQEHFVSSVTARRVFVPIWMGEVERDRRWWMTFNNETYCGDLIRLLGGENIFSERIRRYPLAADLGLAEEELAGGRDLRYPCISDQEIRQAEPEAILLPTEPFEFNKHHVDQVMEQFSDTPAVTGGRVFVVDGTLLTWHGTRLAKALEELGGLLIW